MVLHRRHDSDQDLDPAAVQEAVRSLPQDVPFGIVDRHCIQHHLCHQLWHHLAD